MHHFIVKRELLKNKRSAPQGVPLKRCNSLRNWAVAFFIEGEVTKRQRFYFPLLALAFTISNNQHKDNKIIAREKISPR